MTISVQPPSLENPLVRHPDFDEQFETWQMLADIDRGQKAIKSKGEIYLPATELEIEEAKKKPNERSRYQQRLDRAVFLNGVSRLVKLAMGQLFREDIKIPEEVLKRHPYIKSDMDLLGTPLHDYLRNLITRSYLMGHYFIIVDKPATKVESLQQQRDLMLRPYCVMTDPRLVVDWSIRANSQGKPELEWVVVRDTPIAERKPFQNVVYEDQYKVWYPDHWETKRVITTNDGKSSLQTITTGVNELGVIPVIPIYSQFVRPMVSQPPLEESANLNISHYNLYSAFNNGLLFHLNPLLVFMGVHEQGDIKLHASSSVMLPHNSDAKYVETAGSGLKVAKDSADHLADQIMASGLRSNDTLGANTSGEARRLSRSDFITWLKSVATRMEAGIGSIFKLMDQWEGNPILEDEAYRPTLNKDYDVTVIEANMAEFLLKAKLSGAISHETMLSSLQKGEVLDKELDIKAEVNKATKDYETQLTLDQKYSQNASSRKTQGNVPLGGTGGGSPTLPNP